MLSASPPSPRSEIRSSCSHSRPLYGPTALSLEAYYLGDGMGTTETHDLYIFKMRLAADGGSALPSPELETSVKVTLLF